MPDIDTCPRCHGPVRLDPAAPPPHWGKWCCDTCCDSTGKPLFLCWARTPMTRERAAAWVMPFGEYKGKTLAQINEFDRPRLWWMVENVTDNPNLQRAVSYFLDSTPETTPCKQTI